MTRGIGKEFLFKTRYEHLEKSQQEQGMPQPPLEAPYDVAGRLFDLPSPDELPMEPVDLRAVIAERRSVRKYAPEPMTQAELSYLLWATQGIKSQVPGKLTRRTVPSAGARHAFETVLMVNNVEGLPSGLYRYLAGTHQLVTMRLGESVTEDVTHACLNQAMVRDCAVAFIWMVVLERMYWRYGERGYRLLFLDVGHVCQNLYLAAWPLNYGVCAIGAFFDDQMDTLLGLDGEEQFVIYAATVGQRPRD